MGQLKQRYPVQTRWNYRVYPNNSQEALMDEWLITLRKHRNYLLAERERGYKSNNQNADEPVLYNSGAFCEVETRIEYGSYCPLTCPVVKHGVMSAELTKISQGKLTWGTASDVQSKRTTELRQENDWYSRVASSVLQGNLAKLDAAYKGFFDHKRGFPAFRRASNFKSFQYKPGQAIFTVNRTSKHKHCYSHVHLPGLGTMRYLDSRRIPENAEIRMVVVKKEADGWYISVLLNLPEELPPVADTQSLKSAVGLDVGINKLVSLSDGSFVENPKVATNKRMRRRLRIRQRRVNRKQKGSNNRRQAGMAAAKLHKKLADLRDDVQWKAANKVVKTADAVVKEDLNIKAMKARCKPKKAKGRFLPNGQAAKRGLNRSISDAAWSDLFKKIGWLAAKLGKPVIEVNPQHTSQECSSCGHVSAANRDGEKFLCEACGYLDHADTQAARTILRRANLSFVSHRRKQPTHHSLVPTGGLSESYAQCSDSASNGKRNQAGNRTSKAKPENRIPSEHWQLSLFG